MADEIELKFLDINKEAMIKKIEGLGAEKQFSSPIHAVLFEGGPVSFLDTKKHSLRVRSINGKNILTWKGPKKPGPMKIREEKEVEVDDLEKTCEILVHLGFCVAGIMDKHRVHYELGNYHFEIEDIEGIPTYLEIEAENEEMMRSICDKLDLDFANGDSRTMMEIWPEKFR